MADDKIPEGGGFNPLPPITRGPTLEQEEEAMRGSSRGATIAAGVVCALLAMAGLVWVMRSGGENEYAALGRQINGMRQEHFDGFWGCALPRANIRELQTAQQLQDEINQRARTNPQAYAQLIRSQCQAHLHDHLPLLDQLIVPEDLAPVEGSLRAALESLDAAVTAYTAHLEQMSGGYDPEEEQLSNLLRAVARGWYDYRVAHGQFNDIVREHVNE